MIVNLGSCINALEVARFVMHMKCMNSVWPWALNVKFVLRMKHLTINNPFTYFFFGKLCYPQMLTDAHEIKIYFLWYKNLQNLQNKDMIIKGTQSDFSTYFSNFWRFWYHRIAHIFLITQDITFHNWKVFHLEDINETMPGDGSLKWKWSIIKTYTVRYK